MWERGASVGVDFDLPNFQDLLFAKEHIKSKEKHKRSPQANFFHVCIFGKDQTLQDYGWSYALMVL